jgi:hypothetical protein
MRTGFRPRKQAILAPEEKLHDDDLLALDALMSAAWQIGLEVHRRIDRIEMLMDDGVRSEGNWTWDPIAKKVIPNSRRSEKAG